MAGMRVFGLGSGIDIDQMVADMMKVERDRRVTNLEKDKQINLWKQEAYQEINKEMANFILDVKEDLGLSGSTAYGTLYNKSSDSFTWVKSASSSDETKATARATANALNGTYSLNITQLAEGVSKTSTGSISVAGKTSTDKLYEQFASLSSGETITFKIKTHVTESDSTNYPDGYAIFSFDTSVDTLDDVIAEINNANIGIQAAYDSDLDRFFLNTTSTGSSSYFQVIDDSHGFLSTDEDVAIGSETGNNILKLKIANDKGGSQLPDTDTYKYSGKDLQFDFGDATGLTKSSNTFSINGINITAKSTGTTNIAVETDVDAIYEKISNFVEKYNEVIGKINEKLSEKVYRDYEPLTDEEKEALSEEQIKKWENMAKSGLLKNDSILSSMMSNIRLGMYETVSGLSSTMNQLTEIGIETGEYSEKGKLVIDETELKEAIINNASGVIDLLFKEPTEYTDDEDKYNKSGLVIRLFDTMVEGMKDVIDKAGPGNDSELLRDVRSNILTDFVTGTNLKNGSISIIEEELLKLEEQIERQEDMLARIEDRYYSQFSAMETALNEMNQQSSWLMSQLGM
ncbi:MAG: flagellar hook-associated protein 2 [Candidatus Petromonas sp.]|jgi:flagellar hook-associated protein 2|nr:flagellar hook-associated protein 2 [Candidatus Petromonas sp.]